MDGQKVLKILDFCFIDTWNNIDQLQQSGSCIRMSEGCIWVGRIQAQILLEGHKSISIYICATHSSYKWITTPFIMIYMFSRSIGWKITRRLFIHPSSGTNLCYSPNRSICNQVIDEQVDFKIYDFSSITLWGYVDHDQWCGSSTWIIHTWERALAHVRLYVLKFICLILSLSVCVQ